MVPWFPLCRHGTIGSPKGLYLATQTPLASRRVGREVVAEIGISADSVAATEKIGVFAAAAENSRSSEQFGAGSWGASPAVSCRVGYVASGFCSPCTPGGGAGLSGPAVLLSPGTPGGGAGSRVELLSGSPSVVDARVMQQRVIDFGGIMDAAASGLRTSDRIRTQPSADFNTMDWAMDRSWHTVETYRKVLPQILLFLLLLFQIMKSLLGLKR